MAEFRLGRVKFVWQGDWAGSTTYYQDDVVRYGGRTYICVIGHTSNSSSFYTDLDFSPTRWNLLTDGQTWKDAWQTNTFYALNDIVKYGGNLYIATTAHTSAATNALGLENDQANWSTFAEGIDWKNAWTTNTRYKINDLVRYGGKVYIATAGHTSQASATDGLEADIANWQEFNEGIAPKGDWAISTRYKVNDVVKYGPSLWICKTAHTSDGTAFNTDIANWDQFVEGFEFEDSWSNVTTYQPGDIVVYGGNQYVAKTIHSNAIPSTETDEWGLLAQGFSFQSDWAIGTAYKVGEVVRLRGYTYLATADNTGQEPPNVTYWTRLNSGLQWQGEWVDDQEYKLGDVVRYGSNAYICILGHVSEGDDGSSLGGDANSRPDQDTSGTYWNVLSIGSETDVMNTRGDMIYYGGSGPTRLPIGYEGQVLRAGIEDPEWITLGNVDHVFYVAPEGKDEPAPINGLTLDKPFKTIRYACEQVERGVRNPNAKKILELNRAFIQREIVEWTDYQVANNLSPFTSSFEYDSWKCERDMGIIIDALIDDIGQGSNEKSRKSALAYVNETLGSPYLTQKSETVASINYGLTVIEAVLALEAPAANYQTLNGDNSTAVVEQYLGVTHIETGALAEITDLVKIITDAITAGTDDNIPAEYVPTKIINVKTGKYREVLPIIVPRETCILGDELRSVNAGPATASTDIADAKYSVGALGHFQSIIDDIVTGTTITAQSGNTETQSQEFPFAESLETAQTEQLLRMARHNIDFALNTNILLDNADPTGYNSSFLNGYGDARKNLQYNKKFLQEEVIEYITDNYPTLRYSKTQCKKDVNYIVDAVCYDLTYGGNSQTIVAALAYYDGRDGDSMLDSSEKAATLAAYTYLKQTMQSVATSVVIGPLQTRVTQYAGTAGSAGSSTRIGELIEIIRDVINGGTSDVPNVTVTDIASNVCTTSAAHGLSIGDTFRVRSTANGFVKNRTYWVISVPASTTFTVAETLGGSTLTLTNGTGLTIVGDVVESPTVTDAVTTTTALITAAETLDAAQETIVQAVVNELNLTNWHTDFVVSDDNITATAFEIYVGTETYARTYVKGGKVTKSDGTVLTVSNFVWNNSTGIATVTTSANHNLEAGDVVDITEIQVSYTDDGGNKQVVFPSSTTAKGDALVKYKQVKCLRDVRLITEAVMYDFMFNANGQTRRAAHSYLRASAKDVYDLKQKKTTRDAFAEVKTQAKANVGGDATAQARIETLMTTLDDIVFGGRPEGTNKLSSSRNDHYASAQLERNRDFIVADVTNFIANTYSDTVTATSSTGNVITISDTSWLQRNTAIKLANDIGGLTLGTTYYVQDVVSSTTFTVATTRYADTPITLTDDTGSIAVNLVYNSTLCERDVNEYITAIKYDIRYTGNYKTHLAARYYNNSVLGSLEEDMYYVRNATGIRNQTLADLTGDLGPANEYGTRRPTAGAYVSLDPGWGPGDDRVWITKRSPYVQNVTTFGTAAVGQKIDGALHDGGNDSIVSNDFTQVISDGIGAWVTNNGRAELVSVFTYYGHIGYLAENGGKIRGTNGNNSYGDFGSVAEGFDSTETEGKGIVDNKFQYVATVGEVTGDGAQEILQFAYNNAGSHYSEVNWELNGSGTGAAVEQTDFRDNAVFQVRLLDNVDDSTDAPEAAGNFGGFGYLSNANTAQGGTSSSVTIAATDSELSSAYIGMNVLLTGGSGAGQFGLVETYNAGSKIAGVVRRVKQVTPANLVTSSKYVITSLGSTDFSTVGAGSTPFVGEIFTATGTTTGTGTVDLVESGWDHVVPGYSITVPDASTTYVLEPAINFSEPSTSATVTADTDAVGNQGVEFLGLHKTFINQSATGGNGTGATFDITVKDHNYTVTLYTGGQDYERLDELTILGSSVGYADNTDDITITITSVDSDGTILAFDADGYGRGGTFYAFTGSAASESIDGVAWTAAGNTPTNIASSLRGIASGELTAQEVAGSFITGRSYSILTVSDTSYTAIGSLSNALGTTFVATGPGTGSGTALPNQNIAVALAANGSTSYSYDAGANWSAGGNLPSGSDYRAIAYGNGRWMAVQAGSASAGVTANGTSWTTITLPNTNNWTDIAYGGGTWVVVAENSNTIAYSTDNGSNWSTSTALAAGNTGWNSIAYGNNRFILANDNGNASIVYSVDNAETWTSVTTETSGAQEIHYGQGVFLLARTGGQNIQTSEFGITWIDQSNSGQVSDVFGFGNPNYVPMFVGIDNGTGTVKIATGARAKARAFVSEEKIFAVRITDPGSGYASAPTMSITDPNNTYEAPADIRLGDGVLAQPDWKNRGANYTSASASISSGNGYADFYQDGNYIAIRNMTNKPVAGSNVVFSHLPDRTFKLVNVLTFRGDYEGSYNAFFQISPEMTQFDSPEHGVEVTTRIRYSQVRLTGHDFLDIGSGNFASTNYPGLPLKDPLQSKETSDFNGGRVFYTSTDQDGNFRVGELFTIEQSTGIATLNADAFNIAGLQELTLGEVTLGGNSATINEFSTDPFFTADSDSVVPTQRAIKAYISSQIGGGGASLNVNSVTSGFIYIANDEIQTTTGGTIKIKANVNFQGGVVGLPLAWNYFIT